MKIAVLGADAVGSTIGRLWHAAGHDVTFAARHATRPRALAAELGERAHAASAGRRRGERRSGARGRPGPRCDRRATGSRPAGWPHRDRRGQLAKKRGIRAATAVTTVAGRRVPAGALGGIDDSQLQDPGSALWTYTLTRDEATALVARIKSGDTAAADPLTAPFEKFRDHAPEDPAFFLEHLSRAVFEAGIWRAVDAKWDGIREAFHGFDPAQVAAMTPTEIAATENDARVIRNKAKIRATVDNARQVQAVLDSYGSIRAYLASFPDAHAASADMRRCFKFLGDTGVWRLLIGAARDIGG